MSPDLLQFIRWPSMHRHSILGALLDRLNLTPILNVTGVCGDWHIWNAKQVFRESLTSANSQSKARFLCRATACSRIAEPSWCRLEFGLPRNLAPSLARTGDTDQASP